MRETLTPEQQNQTAEYLQVEIEGKGVEDAQKIIDSEIGKFFDSKVTEVINVTGDVGRFNKFVITKFNLGDRFYLLLGVGRNFNPRQPDPTKEYAGIGHIDVLEKMGKQTINPLLRQAESHVGVPKKINADEMMFKKDQAPYEISAGLIEVNRERNSARIFGKSNGGYGRYDMKDIEAVSEHLKKSLGVSEIIIEPPATQNYNEKAVIDQP